MTACKDELCCGIQVETHWMTSATTGTRSCCIINLHVARRQFTDAKAKLLKVLDMRLSEAIKTWCYLVLKCSKFVNIDCAILQSYSDLRTHPPFKLYTVP